MTSMLMDPTLSCFLSRVRFSVFSSSICYFYSSSPNPKLDRFICSSPSTTCSDRGGEGVKNPILRRALVKQPPTTLNKRNLQENSCCFIGTILSPFKKFNDLNCHHQFRVFTLLKVCNHLSSFRIFLEIRDELAEVAFRRLEREDVIYAWGQLSSYDKIVDGGKNQIFQKLIAKKVNYVRMNSSKCQISSNPTEGDERECGVRLRLWQLFFASPHEWWDNRGSGSWGGDFRHKDTHESLRLCPDDPEWVKKQLEMYDSKMSEMGSGNCGGWSSII